MIHKIPRLLVYTLVGVFGVGIYLVSQAASIDVPNAVVTGDYVTITWNTNTATNTCVKYSMSSSAVTGATALCESGLTTSHSKSIYGLSPGMTYYYIVGYTDPSPEGFGTSFNTFYASGTSGGGSTASPTPTPTPMSSGNWISRTWTFSNGTTQSYILSRTDAEYTNFLASVAAQCQPLTLAQWANRWKPNAGNEQNWQEFGIPECSISTNPTPTPTPFASTGPLTLSVTQPTSGACIANNSTLSIYWSVTGDTSQFDFFALNYFENNTWKQSIGTIPKTQTMNSWTVPGTAYSDQAKIKIEAWTNNNSMVASAYSNAFSVRSSCSSATPSPTPSQSPVSSGSWISRTWTFSNGTAQSNILNRTDAEYTNFLASVAAQCQPLTLAQWANRWKPNAGNEQNWQEFGIPECSTTASSTPTPTPYAPSPGSPATPTNLSGNWSSSGSGNGTVTLAWTDNATNESSTYIYRRMQGGSAWTFESSVGANIASAQRPAPATNSTYEYYVVAYNSLGNSAMSNIATVTIGSTVLPSSMPTPTPNVNAPYVQNWGVSVGTDGKSAISFVFNKEMTQSTFTDTNVYVYKVSDTTLSHIPVTIAKDRYSVTLWSLLPLSAGSEYVSVVKKDVKSLAGYLMVSDYTCRFTALASGYLTSCGAYMSTATPSPTPMFSPSPTPYPSPMPSGNLQYVKTLKGMVRTSNGLPVTDVQLGAWKQDTGSSLMGNVNANGEYSMSLTGGSWQVGIAPKSGSGPSGYGNMSKFASFAEDNTAETRVMDFLLDSASSRVIGRVRNSDGTVPAQTFVGADNGSGFGSGGPVAIDGTFSISLPAGSYRLGIYQEGKGSMGEPLQFSLGDNETKDMGTIVVAEMSDRITGTVKDSAGHALPNIPVHAFIAGTQKFVRAVTGSDGRYVLYVTPGVWMVRAEPLPESNYANPNPPTDVPVTAGVAVQANFILAYADTTVSGAVMDESGTLVSNFYGYVSAGDPGTQSSYGGPVMGGKFSFRVKAGTYVLYLHASPDSSFTAPAAQTVTILAGTTKNVVFKVTRNASLITGQVKDESGAVLKNLSLRISASGGTGTTSGTSNWQEGFYNPDTGSYRINVGAGTWYLSVFLQDSYGYIPPKQSDLVVAVTQGQSSPKDIVLKKAGSLIQGTVRKADGMPFSHAFVSVDIPYGGAAQVAGASYPVALSDETDDSGQYRISVPAGTYVVRAFAPASSGMLNPEHAEVTIGANETKTVDLRFRSPSAVITGRVEGASTKVFVYAWSDRGGYAETETASDGTYSINVTKDETWKVATSRESDNTLYRSADTPVAIGNRDRVEQNLTPLPGRRLPDPVSHVGESSQANIVGVKDGASIAIPPNAFTASGKVTITVTPDTRAASQSQERIVGIGYAIEVRGQDTRVITDLNSDAVVTVPFSDADVAGIGINSSLLKLSYWDETSANWRKVENSTVDTSRKTVSGSVNHLTRFALVAPADTQPPDPPYNVKVAAVSGGFSVNWSNPSFDFHHAKLYRSESTEGLGTLVANNIAGTSISDSFTQVAGKTYYYVVRAIDLAGNESANVTKYTTAGPVTTPSAKELGPQSIPSTDTTQPLAIPAPNPQIPAYQKYSNGTLLRATGDQKVWIITNGFRRYVVGPQILGFYPHLKNAPIVDVPKDELDKYSLAAWVRYVNSPKVYEVNDDATKHWLDMSAEDFYNTGRRWEAVFIINKQENDFYKNGVNVTIIK